MVPISEEEFLKYYQNSPDFFYVGVPLAGVALWARMGSHEICCIEDKGRYLAKYLYWRV